MEEMKQKMPLEIIKRRDIFKMIIPEEVEKKIRYICQQVSFAEWSGVLFYEPEGNFKDNSLTIICKDICVLNIGSSTYTEFNMSPEVINYMTDNNLLNYQTGLIHSHCTFSTFFSNTDVATLKEEGSERNHFVSLIVNNVGTYTAAITRLNKSIKTIQEDSLFKTFNNKEESTQSSYQEENETLEYFILDIEIEGKNQNDFENLKLKLDELKREKEATKVSSYIIKPSEYSEYNKKFFSPKEEKSAQTSLFPEYDEGDWTFNDIDEVRFNRNIIKSAVLQLITGSAILPNESKINASKWTTGMVSLFEKRFGKGEEGLSLFRSWAEGYIEFLCLFTEDEKLEKMKLSDYEITSIFATDLAEELSKLPSNKYIKEYIDILSNYII